MMEPTIDQDDFIKSMEGAVSDDAATEKGAAVVRGLSFWSGPVSPEPLSGGVSNLNFTVVDRGRKYAVRVGEDNEVMGVSRANEVRALEAAGAVGVGPKVHFHQPGVIVVDFIEGRALEPMDLRDQAMLARVAATLRRVHLEVPHHLGGRDFCFWPYHQCRWYLRSACEGAKRLPGERSDRVRGLLDLTTAMERVIGAVNVVFGHNDLLPQNVMEAGGSILFVDWEYAGFGPDLFDLGGLMMNAEPGEELTRFFLSSYYQEDVTEGLWRRFFAMMIIAAVREAAWSMVMETCEGDIQFDYGQYSTMCLQRVDRMVSQYAEKSGLGATCQNGGIHEKP